MIFLLFSGELSPSSLLLQEAPAILLDGFSMSPVSVGSPVIDSAFCSMVGNGDGSHGDRVHLQRV